ncbi:MULTISPECIES: hypothetical protein [unclassified Streptomyces]|uniref:hypothetical protein n=1 Tax=unclassified Streptomyces TaxID=2593676 RepID=UPI000F6EBA13|nr:MULTISPECIES: hypothetical protein [unclassified Streptomyces]AZM93551.1 hypothetical protein D1J60_33880 [Streptomyces sp. W1SF4]RSS39006.1 hypothetical protein EF912_33560 [Streptomyces sp. WAC07061]
MGKDVLGLVVGMALGFAGWFGGFGAFLLVAALGGLGYAAGRHTERGGDLRDLLVTERRQR